MTDDILLSLRGLKKYFRTSGGGVLHANERVDLDIGKGETLGVVGESGSGKSTLGRTVLGLYGATSGEIIYYGKTVFELAPKYVVGILKHPRRILRRAERLKARAERLRRRADAEELKKAKRKG